MSVDIIMYKVLPLSKDEMQAIRHMNVNDLDELDGWELKAYSFEEMSDNPARFEPIKPFLKTVELMYTRTDYRACFVEHGMPAETKSYSMQYSEWGCKVCFDGKLIEITRGNLDKFTTTNRKTFCVVKRKRIDADVDSWVAKNIMAALEKVIEKDVTVDLSYTPILLDKKICEEICRILVGMYDDGEIFYPNAELGKFMLELMRAMCKQEEDLFIEFQD